MDLLYETNNFKKHTWTECTVEDFRIYHDGLLELNDDNGPSFKFIACNKSKRVINPQYMAHIVVQFL